MVLTFRTGLPWRDLPERFGPWRTVHGRFARWAADGTFDRLLAAARTRRAEVDWLVANDSTIVRAHQHAAAQGSSDKGYSVRGIRAHLRRRGIKATIPERVDRLAGRRRRRERPCAFDRSAQRRRDVVERCFHRLKQWRGIATRYDRHPDRYLAAITLAGTLIWLDQRSARPL